MLSGILSTLDCQWKGARSDPFGGLERVTGVAIERHSFSEFSHLLLDVLLAYHGQPILSALGVGHPYGRCEAPRYLEGAIARAVAPTA